ncbi:MAG TPA: extracellular solute-binding protein [Thermoanaerobaculia bacterium]|jgi:spermidine/putrescine transport system substrate-binding protein|nr:extracellular solute-binding protein [Thermoanaerobaculia bacterium]
MKKYIVPAVIVIAVLVVAAIYLRPGKSSQGPAKELRVLAWVGYEEPEIVNPFEKEFGVKVRTETFTGADKMFAKLTQAPDAYDVVVIDPEYIQKLHNAGLLTPLDESSFNFADYIEPLKKFPLCWIDGKLYTVLIRYGINGLVYNTDKLTAEDVSSYSVLWSEKVKGKVGMWDWYLPSMGVLSLASGFNPPYKLGDEQFQTLDQRLTSLRPQVKAVMPSFSDINAALARGDIWVVPALGEHTAAVLAEQGLPINWTIPKEGGVMWIETLGIPPQAKNRDAAIRYIRYMQRPEVQALLTWRRAYRSNIPSIKGIELLTPKQKDALKVHNAAEATALVNSVHIRMLPTNLAGKTTEQEWQTAWQRFKAAH